MWRFFFPPVLTDQKFLVEYKLKFFLSIPSSVKIEKKTKLLPQIFSFIFWFTFLKKKKFTVDVSRIENNWNSFWK